jgi:hypothetical protein
MMETKRRRAIIGRRCEPYAPPTSGYPDIMVWLEVRILSGHHYALPDWKSFPCLCGQPRRWSWTNACHGVGSYTATSTVSYGFRNDC